MQSSPIYSLYRRISRTIFNDPLQRLQFSLLVLLLLNILGTVVYMLLEHWSVLDALYMTVITIATVGYGEVRPLTPAGQVFTIVLIYLGIGTATTAITNAIGLTMGPLLWGTLQKRRMRQMIDKLSNHYIVCGYGRMGRQIIKDLEARGEAFVLIDTNDKFDEQLSEAKIPVIFGDATEDETLLAAGIKRAKGLVSSLNSDAGNIMTVLTARELNPKLFIAARIVRPESESKLRRAGANRVVNPYQIGGHRLTISLLRPAVHDFLDQIFHFGDNRNMDIGQVHVHPNSEFDGKTIINSGLRDKYKVNILAIRRATGEIDITPNPTMAIEPDSDLIIIGPPEAIYKLERMTIEGED